MWMLCLVLALFLINFGRTPRPSHALGLVAASYGTVHKVVRTHTHTRIISYLSPLDVHMQYVPCDGVLRSTVYDRNGTFNLAYDLGKSRLNEKRIHVFDTAYGEVTVIQIAGYLTRRIDAWVVAGQSVCASAPLGFIHLGSRVDVILPSTLDIKIKVGCKLVGGVTRLV